MARTYLFFLGLLTVAALLPGTLSLEETEANEVNKGSAVNKDIEVTDGKGNNGYKVCPDKWVEFGDKCYRSFYEEKSLSWIEATILCELNGGQLAEPASQEISDFLYEMGTLYEDIGKVKRWYLGLSDIGEEGNWVCFYSGEKPESYLWGPDKPNTFPGNSLDCSMMTMEQGSFYWEDVGCIETPSSNEPIAPICQRQKFNCPPEAIYNNHCYIVGPNHMPFEEAESFCIQAGGHLASVHSAEEDQFIFNLAGPFTRYMGAILLDNSTNPWTWSWNDGSDFTYTGTWFGNEPGDSDSRICLGSDLKWYLVLPTYRSYPVCKL